MTKMQPIENILKQKRLRWLGHLLRGKDTEPAKERLMEEIKNQTKYGRTIMEDLGEITLEQAKEFSSDRNLWRSRVELQPGKDIS